MTSEQQSSRWQWWLAIIRRWKVRLSSLFWLQFFLAPLFLSPLSHRFSNGAVDMGLLLFVIAPLFYCAALAWFTSKPTAYSFPWASERFRQRSLLARGMTFGAFFGALGFLPYAVFATIDILQNHDPSLPVSRWMLLVEPLELGAIVGFFAAFYSLFGLAAGGALEVMAASVRAATHGKLTPMVR